MCTVDSNAAGDLTVQTVRVRVGVGVAVRDGVGVR